jgi:glycosyltransferase involved in cell wall biosynthesis
MAEALPRISVALIAYNQEAFIREAVEGVLAQDYANLEVVLSDDCSTDGTFAVMEKVVAGYTGPHQVRLNRNDRNLGIGAHVNRCHRMTSGELIVHADGDDVSRPNRVSRVYAAFCQSGQRPSLVCSNALAISKEGVPQGEMVPRDVPALHDRAENPMLIGRVKMLGCTVAISREVVERFAAIADPIMAADVVWFRRAYLLDGVFYLPEVLVHYRRGTGGVSQSTGRFQDEYLRIERKWTRDRCIRFEQMRSDIYQVRPEGPRSILDELDRQEATERRKLEVLSGGLAKSAGALAAEYLRGTRSWASYREVVRPFLIRWLPATLRYQKRK